MYGRLSEGTPDRLGRATAAATTTTNTAGKTPVDFRIKEEPVRPPESPLPDGNSRNDERKNYVMPAGSGLIGPYQAWTNEK